jgi:hypothetical protein
MISSWSRKSVESSVRLEESGSALNEIIRELKRYGASSIVTARLLLIHAIQVV